MTAQSRVRCYIAIGSNQGERLALCEAAVVALSALPGITLSRRSTWYETEPVVNSAARQAGEQPSWFINGVVELRTTLTPRQLLDECLRIEAQLGRRRLIRSHNALAHSGGDAQLPPVHSSAGARAAECNSPQSSALGPAMPPHPEPSPYGDKPPFSRPIDLDLLLYGDAVINEPGLTLPHPRLEHRRFVLVPLGEIASDIVHPVLGATIADLLSRLTDSHAVRRLEPVSAAPDRPLT
ncbi:MAG TPA: 2-amino-4-hydroxy-6-hydroxymethyldihydropteridine diphosphokinase [Nitrospiria bacterium]|nr:2-amino-4-hydroxy-6-hydroxymethyldihydropteridine diphosphokinase [Nitrospiria bacterium]